MEDGGRNPPMRSVSSRSSRQRKHREANADPDREIDQYHLAQLLRDSADVVERGEFASLLYEALQDFRIYYKQKYPKTSKKKKNSSKRSATTATASLGRETSAGSQVSASSEKSKQSDAGAILEDLKESEHDGGDEKAEVAASEIQVESEEVADESEEAEAAKQSSSKTVQDSTTNSEESNHEDIDDTAASDPPGKDATVSYDENEYPTTPLAPAKPEAGRTPTRIAPSIPVAVPIITADVSVAPPTPDFPARTLPIEKAVPIPPEKAIPIPSPASGYADTPQPGRSPIPAAAASTPQKGFGKKFKLGATFQNVKKAAKNVTGNITENIKHHGQSRAAHQWHQSVRDDLEIFNETGITMAESSNRRTSADVRSDYKSRGTGGIAGASEQRQHGNSGNNNFTDFESATSHHSNNQYNPGKKTPNASFPPSHNEQSNAKSSGVTGDVHHADATRAQLNNTNPQGQGSTAKSTSIFESKRFARFTYAPQEETFSVDGASEDLHQEFESPYPEPIDPIMESGGFLGSRPSFQRPANKDSTLIANGWIEQFRRSKMRHVWKEVLASLVEGRKPGEVTTLWIQREIANSTSGLRELEPLHRIPMKYIEEVSFSETTTDNQFRIKLYNSTEDFVFRCAESPNDTLRWVQTLKQHEKLAKNSSTESNGYQAHEEKKAEFFAQSQQPPSTKGMPIRDLRAICHGAGINTSGMERTELETAAEEVQKRGTYFDQRGDVQQVPQAGNPFSGPTQPSTQSYPQGHEAPETASSVPQQEQTAPAQQQPPRLGIKELRAICHGAGINTAGMERRELEAAAKEVQDRGTYFAPPPAGMHAPPPEEDIRARQEEYRRQQQQNEELRRRQESEAALKRHQQEVEDARRRAAEMEARRQEEARRRAIEEEQRRRAAEEEARRRAAAEEARRRAAAEEHARRQREAQAAQERYAQQQAAWQKQQQAEEQRRRMAEQQAAEERRRREEAMRTQQQWASPPPSARPPQAPWQQQHQQQAYPQQQYQQQQWQQAQQQHARPQPQPSRAQTPPRPPQPQQQPQRQHSGADNKYAKMANQSDGGDDGQAAITKIKHGILIQWALQPPQLQMLRPIAALVTTIHTVFPPALGVAGHDYFQKWKAISREDVAGANGLPEESKLKKSVRKIRFFLHPDKLPHDLNEEQKFMVKMLWDVTNDSWEEYQKHKEDLDWVN